MKRLFNSAIGLIIPVWFIIGLIQELREWYIVYKTFCYDKEVIDYMEKNDFQINWLGWPYKIVIIPDKLIDFTNDNTYDLSIKAHVANEIKINGNHLIKTQTADMLYLNKIKNAKWGEKILPSVFIFQWSPKREWTSLKSLILNLSWYTILYSCIIFYYLHVIK
jgi:hypothetical protein